MNIIYWLIFGLITGTAANFISPGFRGGIIGSIILGVIGAIVGGYLGVMFLNIGVTGFNLASFAVAIGGALIVLFISRLI
jgi:uncharacterized membrane protein YeaQ/YmgE (transglycosylase-associated protein family)